MATKKKQASASVTQDLFGLTEDERKAAIERWQRVAKTLRSTAEEIDLLLSELSPTKRRASARARDEEGEPTFRYLAKVPFPKDFYATKAMIAYARKIGFSESDLNQQISDMRIHYTKKGIKWQDWTSALQGWLRRSAQWRAENAEKKPGRTSDTLQEFT